MQANSLPPPSLNQDSAQQQMQELLSQMHGLHLPGEIGVWPLAPAWYVLILLTLIVLLTGSWYFLRRHREKLYQRQATSETRLSSLGYGRKLPFHVQR